MNRHEQTEADDSSPASGEVAGCNSNFRQFEAVTIKRSGSFELDMTPDYALPLFTAPGEKLWISVWDPVILHGDGYQEGTVWVTEMHGNTTYWQVAEYDTEARRAQYTRVTRDTSIGTVAVSVTANGKGGSIVTVSYQLTGLSEVGNKSVQELLDEANYAALMEEWRSMIHHSRDKIDACFAN